MHKKKKRERSRAVHVDTFFRSHISLGTMMASGTKGILQECYPVNRYRSDVNQITKCRATS